MLLSKTSIISNVTFLDDMSIPPYWLFLVILLYNEIDMFFYNKISLTVILSYWSLEQGDFLLLSKLNIIEPF